MKNSFDEKILEEANDWVKANQKVVLATVIQTWGSSPRPTGSRMIVNENGDFSGSVSGGCVEGAVIVGSQKIMKEDSTELMEFGVADEDAWSVGLGASRWKVAEVANGTRSAHLPGLPNCKHSVDGLCCIRAYAARDSAQHDVDPRATCFVAIPFCGAAVARAQH